MPTATTRDSPRTIVVLGISYGGYHTVQTLVSRLPEGWRVVAIDRNTHFNHFYAFTRVAVLPGHEHKVFIPHTNIFSPKTGASPHSKSSLLLHANVTSIQPTYLTYTDLDTNHYSTLSYDYLIYAAGSHLPPPINVWSDGVEMVRGTKVYGSEWLRRMQAKIRDVKSVLVIGGGPLGVQFATDIADIHPNKPVTLVHSRPFLLPRFEQSMHDVALSKLEDKGVTVVLNSRVDLASGSHPASHGVEICYPTSSGIPVTAELVLVCTGQTPSTSLLQQLSPHSINPATKAAYVTRSLQLALPSTMEGLEPTELATKGGTVFVVGDAAEAFGALNSGSVAYYQGEMAAKNVLKLIAAAGQPVELERYVPPAPAIKVTLGRHFAVHQRKGVVGTSCGEECDEILGVHNMWTKRGLDKCDMTV